MKYQDHVVLATTPLFEVMAILEKRKPKIVFIVDDEQCLLGSITDGDVRRYGMLHHTFEASAKEVMKAPCLSACSRTEAIMLHQKHQISCIPLVNGEMKLVDIWFDGAAQMVHELEAQYRDTVVVMMAGGRGERLYPYTAVLPKPLIPIQGVPIAQRIMERFVVVGLQKFFMSINYKKNIIKAYFDEVLQDVKISYYEEEQPTGTAGSLRAMRDELTQDFIVINCDILIDVDIEDLLRFHKRNNNTVTIVSALKALTIPYGVLEVEALGNVVQMKEKPVLNHFINTGMYVVSPEAFDCFPSQEFCHMTEVIQNCMNKGMRVQVYVIGDGAFMDMGQLDELDDMQRKLHKTGG